MKRRLIEWIAGRLPPCNAIAERASAALDRALTPRERIELWAHLRLCALCRRYSAQLGTIRDVAHIASAGEPGCGPSGRLSAESRERIGRTLREK